MTRLPLRALIRIAAFVCVVLLSTLALAQHEGGVGQAPPPPPGPGSLTVQLETSDPTLDLEGIDIGLYALANGQPGVTNGVSDAQGRTVFSGISNDPGVIYLVGARIGELMIPTRLTFAPGEVDATVTLAVANPTTRIEGVTVSELRARVDWMGDRLIVTELVTLANPGSQVIQVPATDEGPAIFERLLPPGAKDFNPGPTAMGDEFALVGDRVRFYGPLYSGEQRVEYQWSLPLDGDAPLPKLTLELREAAARVVVIAGTEGMELAGEGLVPSRALADEERVLASWARDGLGPGARLDVAITLPEIRNDPTSIVLPQTLVRLDLDDTRLEATTFLEVSVSPGAPVAGTPEAPLLQVRFPADATDAGVSQEAEAFGLVQSPEGGFDILGPIPPGQHTITYFYQLASSERGVDLDLRFPREVQTLNVLIYDNQLAVKSSRLHRRRPFREGTRNVLHREAFNVGMHESVDLSLAPIRGPGFPTEASLALTIAGVAGAAWFMIAPLRRSQRREAEIDPELLRIREEREGVYSDIADLEHDFETGKLDEADYDAMHDTLRAQAISLLREERARSGSAGDSDAAAPDFPAKVAPAPTSEAPTPVVTGAFCPSCGERVDPKWSFCSHCGAGLAPGDAGGQAG